MNLNNPLPVKDNLIIRAFRLSDIKALRQLCSDTAFIGKPVEVFLNNREIFADWGISYYVNFEAESIFLAEYDDKAVGYIIGCRDETRYKQLFFKKILPSLMGESIKTLLTEHSARIFFFNLLKSIFRSEFRRPDFSNIYPAHLHINVAGEFRGLGIGSLLTDRFLSYLNDYRVKAVRLATISPRAINFFERKGFKLLYQRRITYFSYLTDADLFLRIYGMTLTGR